MIDTKDKKATTDSSEGIFAIVLTASVVAALYFAREMIIPLVLAALLAFLLSPFVTRLERVLGRTPAVLIVVAIIVFLLGTAGWFLTRQMIDLAIKLPDYRANIEKKLQSIHLPSPIKRVSQMVVELKAEVPGAPTIQDNADIEDSRARVGTPAEGTPSAIVVKSNGISPLNQVSSFTHSLFSALVTFGIVMVLLVKMLLKREDLCARFIRLVGQKRATNRAMEDAGTRLTRYLITQFMVNVSFGIAFTIGLYCIGVPNASLWGALSAVLRFIPYIGSSIAGAFTVVLALAASP